MSTIGPKSFLPPLITAALIALGLASMSYFNNQWFVVTAWIGVPLISAMLYISYQRLTSYHNPSKKK